MGKGGFGPGYTVDDLVYYMGLFGGMIIGVLTLRAMGYHNAFGIPGLVPLLGGVACGVVLGFACGQIWERMKQPPRGPEDGPYEGPR